MGIAQLLRLHVMFVLKVSHWAILVFAIDVKMQFRIVNSVRQSRSNVFVVALAMFYQKIHYIAFLIILANEQGRF